MPVPNLGDELHHTGWNACSSCHFDPTRQRSKLVMPGLASDRVYIVDVTTDPIRPKIEAIVEPEELHKVKVGAPHTAHCLADGNIMISTMGDESGNAKGDFVLIDGKDFKVIGSYMKEDKKLDFGQVL